MLLSNPLAYPLLPSLSLTLIGLFAGSLLALLVGVRGRWSVLAASVLFQRWRSWLVIAPVFSAVILLGVLPLAVFAAALAIQGGREYASLADLHSTDRWLLLALSAILPLISVSVPASLAQPGLLVLPLLLSAPVLLQQDVERGVQRM